MSESNQFANYTNSTQRLAGGINQEARTSAMAINDHKLFEQQFLSGSSVVAKTKLTDAIIKTIKNSKTFKNVGKAAEDAKEGFGNATKKVVNDASAKLQQGITKLVKPNDVPPPPATGTAPDVPPPPSTGTGLDTTEAEMRAGSQEGKAAAKALADRGITKAPDIDAPLPNSAEGSALNAARTANPASQQELLAQQGRDALQAGKDAEPQILGETDTLRIGQLARPTLAPSQIVNNITNEGDDAVAAAKEAKRVSELSKVSKVSKDVEEDTGESDEADPLGLVVTAIAAIATSVIGRSIKAHISPTTGASPAPVNFTQTLGA